MADRRGEITATTGFVGVIGDPVGHSLSPQLHNAAYVAMGLDLVYGAFTVAEGRVPAALTGARALGLVGLSVTTPHKYAVARAADQCSSDVELLGAANTVVFRGGASIAHSTDGGGFIADLRSGLLFEPAGRRCAVLGAGGAARAIILALGAAGAKEVLVVNRTATRALDAARLAPRCGRVGALEEIADADLVVNATSIGLAAGRSTADDPGVVLAQSIGAGQVVIDLVYEPSRTVFLTTAATHGAVIRNGLGMLVHQAALQVELFTGGNAPIAVMWDAVAGRPTE